MTTPGNVAAIVLAAGRGQRFGPEPKLLADLEGTPLVRHAVRAALDSEAAKVLVVVGDRDQELRAALADLPVEFVPNPDFADGLSTSVRAGFAARPQEVEALVVLLGDMPRVSPRLIDGLIAAWRQGGMPDAAVPVRAGRRGNPVLLGMRLAPEIARLTGDVGAALLLRGRSGVLEWETDDEGIARDVDTPDALADLARPAQASARTTPLSTAE